MRLPLETIAPPGTLSEHRQDLRLTAGAILQTYAGRADSAGRSGRCCGLPLEHDPAAKPLTARAGRTDTKSGGLGGRVQRGADAACGSYRSRAYETPSGHN